MEADMVDVNARRQASLPPSIYIHRVKFTTAVTFTVVTFTRKSPPYIHLHFLVIDGGCKWKEAR